MGGHPRRPSCSEDEFEALVQRNMAANCGLDYRSAAEFIACIAAREMQGFREPDLDTARQLAHTLNIKRALPVLEGLLQGLRDGRGISQQDDCSHCQQLQTNMGCDAETCKSCSSQQHDRSTADENDCTCTDAECTSCGKGFITAADVLVQDDVQVFSGVLAHLVHDMRRILNSKSGCNQYGV